MNEPKLKAFAVTLSFADGGPLIINTLIAPDAHSATAMTAIVAMRGRVIEQNLLGIAVVEMSAEWLRTALRAVETGKTAGDVVSLVSDNLRPVPSEPPKCPIHGNNLTAAGCPDCNAALRGAEEDRGRARSPFDPVSPAAWPGLMDPP